MGNLNNWDNTFSVAMIFAVIVVITYIWLLLEAYQPYGYGSNKRAAAASCSKGRLFDTTSSIILWSISAGAATISIMFSLLYIFSQDQTEPIITSTVMDRYSTDPLNSPLLGFMVSASLWAPVTFIVCYFDQAKWLAAIPVWGTVAFNIWILFEIENVVDNEQLSSGTALDGKTKTRLSLYIPWTVSLLHHLFMDGIIWTWGFVFNNNLIQQEKYQELELKQMRSLWTASI